MKALAVVATFAVFSPAAQASVELIHNGGFESAGGFSGGFETIGSGLDGWTIGGTVDLINTYWTPAAGNYSLDLNGGGAGSISQSFATVVGRTYNVSFSLAGNPVGGGDKFFYASVNAPITYTFDIDQDHRQHGLGHEELQLCGHLGYQHVELCGQSLS